MDGFKEYKTWLIEHDPSYRRYSDVFLRRLYERQKEKALTQTNLSQRIDHVRQEAENQLSWLTKALENATINVDRFGREATRHGKTMTRLKTLLEELRSREVGAA